MQDPVECAFLVPLEESSTWAASELGRSIGQSVPVKVSGIWKPGEWIDRVWLLTSGFVYGGQLYIAISRTADLKDQDTRKQKCRLAEILGAADTCRRALNLFRTAEFRSSRLSHFGCSLPIG